ncbi:MAG: hypothetical protein RQ842_09430 [Vulcanisaeta sp.]|jgi:hypothetical protein|nr:hypothetical protein [Vulcanisaeta sp.]
MSWVNPEEGIGCGEDPGDAVSAIVATAMAVGWVLLFICLAVFGDKSIWTALIPIIGAISTLIFFDITVYRRCWGKSE